MKKYNLLIPMAGLGSRFLEKGYTVYKQLITAGDKHLLDISLSCVDLDECNLIFVVRDDMLSNNNIDTILKKKYGNDIKIAVTNGLTRGCVESCLAAKEYYDDKLPLVIFTLDVEFSPQFKISHMPKDSDGHFLTFKSNSPNYSYVAEEDGRITRTAEKKVISEHACTGIYCFKSGKTFISFAEAAVHEEDTTPTGVELHVTPLYNKLIAHDKKITRSSVRKMHIFGTPEEFEFYRKNSIKVFGEGKLALASDHSGYKTKELFKMILDEREIKYVDYGTYVDRDCDYKDFVSQAAKAVQEGECSHGVVFCRTGQGVNICSNKFKGIRSALVYDKNSAEMAIQHNCANFFALPAFKVEFLRDTIDALSSVTFDGGRHQKRIMTLED